MREWTFLDATQPEFTFDEHVTLSAEGVGNNRVVGQLRTERVLPVRVVSEDPARSVEDLLAIDVVFPSKTGKQTKPSATE